MQPEYRSDLYSAAHMQPGLAAQVLLRAARGARRRSTASLTDGERRRLLVDSMTRARSTPHFARQFERQVASAPERTAVGFEGESLGYGELNRRANQWARHLRGLGVAAGVRVGVCIERSPDMLVALLAVQKAGGAAPLTRLSADRLAHAGRQRRHRAAHHRRGRRRGGPPPGVRLFDPAREAGALAALDGETSTARPRQATRST